MVAKAKYFYEIRQGHGLKHDPFNAIVGPRPIGWISSVSCSGVFNLAPYSFFNAFSYRPHIIGFSSLGRKDTLRNIEHTGEFVWNLATRPLAEAVNMTCAEVKPEVSEFTLSGLTPGESRLVKCPRVEESPVSFECRCTQIVSLVDSLGVQASAWLVLGEVIGVHIDPSIIDEGVYQTEAARPIMRGGGTSDYFEVLGDGKFLLDRPEIEERQHHDQ